VPFDPPLGLKTVEVQLQNAVYEAALYASVQEGELEDIPRSPNREKSEQVTYSCGGWRMAALEVDAFYGRT